MPDALQPLSARTPSPAVDSPPTAPATSHPVFHSTSPDYVAATNAHFDHFSRRFIAFQCIRLLHSHPVHHLSAIASHHVEQVVDHLRLPGSVASPPGRTPCSCPSPPLQSAGIARQSCSKGTDSGPAVAVPHPQDAGSLGIHDHGGIAVSLVQGKLIHHQPPHLPKFDGAHTGLQTALVDLLDGVPTDPGELADMADGRY